MYTQGRPDHILTNEGRRCSRHITGRSEPVNSSDLCRDWASCSAPVNVGNFRTESDLRVILSQGLFGSWSGVIFRSVSPRYARTADIVSGYGAYRAGDRWNVPASTRSAEVSNWAWRLTSPSTFYFSTSDGRTAMYHHTC